MKIIIKNVVITVIIASLILTSTIVSNHITAMRVSAEVADNHTLDINLYKADLYAKRGSICHTTISRMLTQQTPAEKLASTSNDRKLSQALTLWKGAHFVSNPSQITADITDEKSYYESMILSTFITETKDEQYLIQFTSELTKETKNIISEVKDILKAAGYSDDVINGDISKLDITSRNEVEKAVKDTLANAYSDFVTEQELLDFMSDAFKYVNSVKDAIYRIINYTKFCKMSDSMKAVLNSMYDKCPTDDIALQAAFKETSMSMNSFNDGLFGAICSSSEDVAVEFIGSIMDTAWGNVITKIPVFAGYKVGTFIGDAVTNTLFATKDIAGNYLRMKSFKNFIYLSKSVVKDFQNDYVNDRTRANAANYFAAVDVLYESAYLSCDYAAKYVKGIEETAGFGNAKNLIKRVFAYIKKKNIKKTYDQIINDIKYSYENDYKSLNKNYLTTLHSEHPSIYRYYELHGQNDGIYDEDMKITNLLKLRT